MSRWCSPESHVDSASHKVPEDLSRDGWRPGEPGGRLKFGDGPGGDPAFHPMDIVHLVAKLIELGLLRRNEVLTRLEMQ